MKKRTKSDAMLLFIEIMNSDKLVLEWPTPTDLIIHIQELKEGRNRISEFDIFKIFYKSIQSDKLNIINKTHKTGNGI